MTLLPTPLEEAAKAMHSTEPWSSFWSTDDARLLATAAITAYLAQAGKEGWVMVPAIPTQAMLKNAVLAVHAFAHSPDRGFHQYNGAWSDEAMRVYSARFEVGYRAMLAARG